MSTDLQKQVLLFATGSDRIPVGGMSEMQFKITRVDNVNMLVKLYSIELLTAFFGCWFAL